MSDDTLTVPQSTLRHRFEDLPPSVISHVRMGLSLLRRLRPEQVDQVTGYVIENFSRRGTYDLDEAARISGIQRNLVGDLLSAVTMIVGSVFDLDVTKDDFLDSYRMFSKRKVIRS